MKTQQIQTVETHGIHGSYATEAPWSAVPPSLGTHVAGLNIAPEVPAMIMSRHIVFDAVIGILSKPFFEACND